MRTSHRGDRVPSELPTVAAARLVGHDGPVLCVRFTADGKYCLTAGQDRTVRLWNPTRIDPHYSFPNSKRSTFDVGLGSIPHALPIQTYTDGHTHPVYAIGIDDQSTTLVSSSDKTLVATDVITRQLQRRFHGHDGRINSVSCSSGGDTLLSASYDGTVRIWDGRSKSSEPIQVLAEATDSVSCVRVVHDDYRCEILTASIDGTVRTYDLRRGQIRCDDFGSSITGMAVTPPDSTNLAVSCLDGIARIIHRASGKLIHSYSGHHSAGQYAVECDVTADGSFILCGSEDGNAVFYDVTKGTLEQSLEGHERPTCSVACHPLRESTSVAITASYDGNAIVWANSHTVNKWERT